jgi:hypothetical protein
MPKVFTSYYVAAFGLFSHSCGPLGLFPKTATKTAENIEDGRILNVALFGAVGASGRLRAVTKEAGTGHAHR